MARKYNYGGQAVIEGVMMRGQKAVVTAVRRPNGEITTEARPIPPISAGRLRRIPFVRGIVVLVEALVLGIQSLLYSANVALEEEKEEITGKAVWGMIGTSVVLLVVLFFLAPLFITKLANNFIPNSLLFHIVEGVVRLGIFIAYLKVISMMPDIKRVFMYHGAEHKTVNAREAGVPLEVADVRKYGTAHARCGTSFLLTVLIIAIIVFAFIGRDVLWVMIVARVVLIPVIMALGYEIIYFSARHEHNWFVRGIMAPGLWLQSMTTSEPDDRQLEVAIAALKQAVAIDEGEAALPETVGA